LRPLKDMSSIIWIKMTILDFYCLTNGDISHGVNGIILEFKFRNMDYNPSGSRVADDVEGTGGAQSIGRALRLLRLLGAAGGAGTALGVLVEQSGLAKPTCRRLLLALIDDGMAAQDPVTRRYFLGREIYMLGMVASERYGIHRDALDCVERLARKTGDAAFLQVRHGKEVVCLAREDGSYPLRSHVLKAGDRHLLGAGAGPIAVLAALPEAECRAFIQAHQEQYEARYPRLFPLLEELTAETRAQGFSMNRGLIFPGSWGMGMAIHDPSGRVIGCLSLAAVESRMLPERQGELAALLKEEVQLVERRLVQNRRDEPLPVSPDPVAVPSRKRNAK
jgi:DNA-binding IclR family transcriptional regulator